MGRIRKYCGLRLGSGNHTCHLGSSHRGPHESMLRRTSRLSDGSGKTLSLKHEDISFTWRVLPGPSDGSDRAVVLKKQTEKSGELFRVEEVA